MGRRPATPEERAEAAGAEEGTGAGAGEAADDPGPARGPVPDVDLDDLDDLDAPEASAYDGPPEDDDEPEPSSPAARVLPFTRPRKRRPKPAKAPKGDRPGLPPKGKARDALTADLAAGVAAVGVAASLGLPTTGYVIADRSEGIASGLVKLAETNPAVAAALVATNTGMTYLDLGTHAGAILVAVMVDRGIMAPDAFPASYLRVTTAWVETHPDELHQDGGGVWTQAPDPRSAPPAPAFVG